MGFLDKAKSAAEFAAQKAKETGETVQTKREISNAFDELGHKAFDLVESGAIAHGELSSLVDRIKELQAKLEAIGEEAEAPAEHAGTPV